MIEKMGKFMSQLITINKYRIALLLSTLLNLQSLLSQSTVIDCREDLQLLNFLVDRGKNVEAINLASDMDKSSLCSDFKDSLFFLKGMAYYQQKMFDSAIYYFQKVKNPDSLFIKSRFLSALNTSYTQDFGKSILILDSITKHSQYLRDLHAVQKAGNYLLLRDFGNYKVVEKEFSYKYYTTQNEEKKLTDLYSDLVNSKIKSPRVSGVLSAIIPGSGKWYSNKKGKAIAAFLTIAVLSAITAEQGIKNGWMDYRTLISASATSVFYIGNIYGSYYETKHLNENFNKEINENILYNMHVSFRNVYY